MNQVILIGNLTKDPEVRETKTGKTVCNFSLAVNERKQDPKSGEWVDHTNFIPIVVWGKQAENCNRFLAKGKKCAVNGKIETGSYEKNGQKVYTTSVVALNVEFLSPVEQQQTQPAHGFNQEPQGFDNTPPGFEQMAEQEQIPF